MWRAFCDKHSTPHIITTAPGCGTNEKTETHLVNGEPRFSA